MSEQLTVITDGLPWGRHYAVVDPAHFRIDYAINPFMDLARQPDPVRARRQWQDLVATLRGLGARVDMLQARPDSPDMVYAMNLGLAVRSSETEGRVVMSHMRHPERRRETASAAAWFAGIGLTPAALGGGVGSGPHVEAGDAFAWRGELLVGFGPRTEEAALPALAAELGVQVRGVRITHPGMYHLDLAFCPLDDRRALVCPDALDPVSAAMLLDLVPEPLVLTEAEALETFCANSVVVGRTVVMPACPDRVRRQLLAWGFDVVIVDVDQFHLGGGSIRCLTNPLDVTLGRDLLAVSGGRVDLPEPGEPAA